MNKIEKLIDRAEIIVFDLGAVILNIDPQRTFNELTKYGFPDFLSTADMCGSKSLFDDFERGRYSPDEFRTILSSAHSVVIEDDQFDAAWNRMLLDFPSKRIEAIKRCARQKPIFLLSNTNKIHFDYYVGRLQHCGVHHLSELFTKAYYSHDIGMRKPDAEIFQFVIDELGVMADKILFFDDDSFNVAQAALSGIITVQIKDGIDIANLF